MLRVRDRVRVRFACVVCETYGCGEGREIKMSEKWRMGCDDEVQS